MERLKELAEKLILQLNHSTEKKELVETVLEMLRFLSLEESSTLVKNIQPVITLKTEESFNAEVDAPSLNEVLRGVEEDLSERMIHSNIPSIRQAIGINDRFVYVEKLFGNNIGRFEKVIDQMDKAQSFEASEQILIDELTRHMPEDAPPALIDQLLSLVRRRFPSK